MTRKALLVSGILASLLYIGTDVLGSLRWEGYSYTSQTVSELSAINAPSRRLVAPLFFAYGVLMIAFGLGVWGSAHRKRVLRVVASLLVGYGVVCLLAPLTPMHQRGAEFTLTDTLHIVGAMVDVLFILLIIGFGAHAFGKRFRRFSVGTMVIVLGFGALAALDGARIAADLPTPYVGVTERISIFSSLVWMAALAIALLSVRDTAASADLARRDAA